MVEQERQLLVNGRSFNDMVIIEHQQVACPEPFAFIGDRFRRTVIRKRVNLVDQGPQHRLRRGRPG